MLRFFSLKHIKRARKNKLKEIFDADVNQLSDIDWLNNQLTRIEAYDRTLLVFKKKKLRKNIILIFIATLGLTAIFCVLPARTTMIKAEVIVEDAIIRTIDHPLNYEKQWTLQGQRIHAVESGPEGLISEISLEALPDTIHKLKSKMDGPFEVVMKTMGNELNLDFLPVHDSTAFKYMIQSLNKLDPLSIETFPPTVIPECLLQLSHRISFAVTTMDSLNFPPLLLSEITLVEEPEDNQIADYHNFRRSNIKSGTISFTDTEKELLKLSEGDLIDMQFEGPIKCRIKSVDEGILLSFEARVSSFKHSRTGSIDDYEEKKPKFLKTIHEYQSLLFVLLPLLFALIFELTIRNK